MSQHHKNVNWYMTLKQLPLSFHVSHCLYVFMYVTYICKLTVHIFHLWWNFQGLRNTWIPEPVCDTDSVGLIPMLQSPSIWTRTRTTLRWRCSLNSYITREIQHFPSFKPSLIIIDHHHHSRRILKYGQPTDGALKMQNIENEEPNCRTWKGKI